MDVWPDGCRDLIAMVRKKGPVRLILSGLDEGVRHVVCSEQTRFIGIRLTPGVIFPWEKECTGKLKQDTTMETYLPGGFGDWDFSVDTDDIRGELIRQIERLASPSPEWIYDYIRELGFQEKKQKVPLSERSIRRALVRHTGASPIFWQRLARARKAGLTLLHDDSSLASIAADTGFSDQAHMNRELRHWFGQTPMMIRSNRETASARLHSPDAFTPL